MYLPKEKINYLIEKNNEMLSIRNDVLKETGVDLIANDTVSLITSYSAIEQYDKNYSPNFGRNGEDGVSISKSNLPQTIEMKACTVKKLKSGKLTEAKFMFHCNNLKTYNRYIFIKWSIERQIYRIWDFSDKNKINMIEHILKRERDRLLEKNNGKTPNRDVINITEKEIITLDTSINIMNNLVYTDFVNLDIA